MSNKNDVVIHGCTSHAQARRVAEWFKRMSGDYQFEDDRYYRVKMVSSGDWRIAECINKVGLFYLPGYEDPFRLTEFEEVDLTPINPDPDAG